MHPTSHFAGGGGMMMTPYAYPLAYGYDAPLPDQSYADSYEPAAVEASDSGWSGPQYASAPEPPPHSMILNMENMEANPEDTEANPPGEPAHYYIALKDHHVYLAVAYWVEGDTLHYFLPGNTHNQVSLALVDRDLTERLNRESNVEVHLPVGK
ncbi:MAG: hypothetical protein WAJ87_06265 [Bryobacteraceae bacterium]